jgi:hypothetical protein
MVSKLPHNIAADEQQKNNRKNAVKRLKKLLLHKSKCGFWGVYLHILRSNKKTLIHPLDGVLWVVVLQTKNVRNSRN